LIFFGEGEANPEPWVCLAGYDDLLEMGAEEGNHALTYIAQVRRRPVINTMAFAVIG